ncbi:MAG: ATP-dependent DNA helicase RecG [Sphaerochaetaceae bacterium]|jgi:ATP-dependent DNA helicase RecG|nr:ATP-dependent DNA helicase RecG [Spirochaetaceae bacterium]MDY6344436.1 ATP-dependent DNA helicase RecG [Sphaerochaetaceae bacterium]
MEGTYYRNLPEPMTKLKGVGPAAAQSYRDLGIVTQSDLLQMRPRAFEDRSRIHPIDATQDGQFVNTKVLVTGHSYFGGHSWRDRILKIQVQDCEGSGAKLQLLCFGRNFLERSIEVGGLYYLYGQVSRYKGQVQCSKFELHPAPVEGMPPQFGKVLPIYPLRGSLSQRIIRRDEATVLSSVALFREEIPDYLREQYHLLPTDKAIRQLHQPASMEAEEDARRTLAFGEFLYMQLFTRRHEGSTRPEIRRESAPYPLELRLIASLPFSLTPDQMSSLKEIRGDLDSSRPMNRLLQGDVGSGKTLVAWVSALHVVSQGKQVAFMAPTELLARQHADGAARLLAPFGVRLAYLTGAVKGKERTLLLGQIAEGNVDIVIGTHALFGKEVVFKNLGYVIIDEQHRFGVEQRYALTSKAEVPDLLLMTATPIPRTLALTVFGDLNVSTLKTMPPGRKPVKTLTVSEASRERMYRAIATEFERGHQAYFVYPRIDDTGESDLRDVTSMYEYLKKEYPGIPSALMHSKLEEEEKMRILEEFKAGRITYLVSTSVVEVGIDIPNATCMVIEHAERFGLAALHQLRGRVGRSVLQSYCFLVFGNDLTDLGKQRLRAMKESNDGFYLAEQDLLIRGPGDIVGLKQSGFLNLQFASLTDDLDLLQQASQAVTRILKEDPGLLRPEHAVIRQTIAESPMFRDSIA